MTQLPIKQIFATQPYSGSNNVLLLACALVIALFLAGALRAVTLAILRLRKKDEEPPDLEQDPPNKATPSQQLRSAILMIPVAIIVLGVLILLYQWFECLKAGAWTEFPVSLMLSRVLPDSFVQWVESDQASSSSLKNFFAFIFDVPLPWCLMLLGGCLLVLMCGKLPAYGRGGSEKLSDQMAASRAEVIRLKRDLSGALAEVKRLKKDLAAVQPQSDAPQSA
ncbi:MAG: hypothetical protein ACYTEL_15565 [Planctomycetota bacterium]|jgi:hypothetical protein